MKIVRIEQSPVKHKRLRAYLEDGSHIDFGLDSGSTYIDHKSPEIKYKYWARHYGNKTERHLIDNLIISPALFSAYILWGPFTNIKKNVEWLNHKLI